MRKQNVPSSGAIIQEKLSTLSKELNIENFKTSDSQLYEWKEQRNITFNTISEKSDSATPEMINC